MAKSSNITGRIAGIIAAVVMVLVLVGVTLTRGHVTGVEFASSHFQLRKFEFYQLPVVHLQISPIWRSGMSSDFLLYLSGPELDQYSGRCAGEVGFGFGGVWHVPTTNRRCRFVRGDGGIKPIESRLDFGAYVCR